MSKQNTDQKNNSFFSWLVFLPILAIVLFAWILGMFPALIATFSDQVRFPVEINVWEPSIWMFPTTLCSFIIFTIMILYQKNKLPHLFTRTLKFISKFEISNRISFLIIGIMLISYVLLTVSELNVKEPWEDGAFLETFYDDFSLDNLSLSSKIIPNVFGYVSLEIFDNTRVFLLAASTVCLFLTYLITVQLSQKRFAGILAMSIVLQSTNFLIYDTTLTYPILWIMFLLLSIYFIFKNWYLSLLFFIPSVFSHPISIGFFPIILIFIITSDLSKKRKLLLLSSYLSILSMGIAYVLTQPVDAGYSFSLGLVDSFDISKIIDAFAIVLSQFRYDGLVVVFILPLIVCLFLKSKKGFSNANSVLILIGGTILMISFIPVLTTMGNTPYRILPLVFFFAIGVGTLLSKKINLQDELLSNKL